MRGYLMFEYVLDEILKRKSFIDAVTMVARAFNAQYLMPRLIHVTRLLVGDYGVLNWVRICHCCRKYYRMTEKHVMKGAVLYALYLLLHYTGKISQEKFLHVLEKIACAQKNARKKNSRNKNRKFEPRYRGKFELSPEEVRKFFELASVWVKEDECRNLIVGKILRKFGGFNPGYSPALRDLFKTRTPG